MGQQTIFRIDELPQKKKCLAFNDAVSYVYILACGDYIKVGETVDPQSRIKRLQAKYKKYPTRWNGNGQFSCFDVVFLLELKPQMSPRIEKRSHLLLSDFRFFRDWFKTDILTAIKAVETSCQWYENNGWRVK